MFNSAWYNSLIKPFLAPPNWIFMPVWSVLYLTIFISLILYITKPAEDKNLGYIYFAIQMMLNLIWSPVFFGMQNIAIALAIVIFLDIFVLLTILKFYSVSKISGLILIPYFLWILFATYLNLGYLLLN